MKAYVSKLLLSIVAFLTFFMLSWCTPSREAIQLNEEWVNLHTRWDYHDAIALFQQAIEKNPTLKEAHYNLWLSYYALQQYWESLASYEQALALDPRYYLAMADKWLTLTQLSRFTDALNTFDEVLAADPANIYALNNKWYTLYIMGKFDEALALYDQVLAVEPTFVKALANKWVATADSGNLSWSVVFFEEALRLDPKDYLTHYNLWTVLSDLWYDQKDIAISQQAIASLATAIELNPTFVDAYVYLAITYYDLEEYTNALDWGAKAIALDNKHENARFYQAQTLQKLNKIQESIDAFKKVMDINPSNVYAWQALDELMNSDLYDWSDRF
jgi:tetratricopeptide (TPR) repeat protein